MSRNTFGIVLWNWSSRSGRGRAPRSRRSDTRRLRPGLLALEGRVLLSSSPTIYTVTDTSDNLGDTGSLRYAITQANANTNPAGSEITFDPTDFATPQTITLTKSLELAEKDGPEVIDGPTVGFAISGNNAVEVFTVDSGVKATLSGLTIENGNEPGATGEGGGLNNEGTTTLTNCTITGNVAGDHGGGLYNGGKATLTLTDCTVSNNYAGGGGGLDNSSTGTPGLTLTDCTISGNVAGDHGGALDNGLGANLALNNCTINGNAANTSGGPGGLNNFGTATLTDTIVAGNTNADGASAIGGTVHVTGTYNLIGKGGSGGLTGSTNQVNVADAGLAPLGYYGGPTQTIPLLPGSAAIGKGTQLKGVTTDQRGFSVDNPIDIGAFQVQNGNLVVSTTTDGGGAPSGKLDLRTAVKLANLATVATTITFDSTAFATPETITLDGSQLGLVNQSASETIVGPAAGVTISGGGLSGVFHVGPNVTASLSRLTITDGYESGATGNGGGIYNEGKSLTLTDCTISANTAGNNGGGLDNVGTANLTLIDCTISGNTADNNGGGLENDSTANHALALTACTISGNYADGFGGGLFNNGAAALNDTIVAGNARSAGASDIHNDGTISGSYNLIGIGFSDGTISGGNNITLANLSTLGLAPLGPYGGPTETMALLPGSAAIGKGVAVSGVTSDQRGFNLDSPTDIGAFQTQPGLVVNTTIDGTNAPSGDLSLRQAVNIADAVARRSGQGRADQLRHEDRLRLTSDDHADDGPTRAEQHERRGDDHRHAGGRDHQRRRPEPGLRDRQRCHGDSHGPDDHRR